MFGKFLMRSKLELEGEIYRATAKLADLWFKVLSWSVILGILKYAATSVGKLNILNKSGNIIFDVNLPGIIISISAFLLAAYASVTIEDIFDKFNFSKLTNILIILVISFILLPVIFIASAIVSEIVSVLEQGGNKKPE